MRSPRTIRPSTGARATRRAARLRRLAIGLALGAGAPALIAQTEITMESILEAPIEPTTRSNGLWCFHPDRRAQEAAYERALSDAVDPAILRAFHEELAAVPHPAGSDGDRRTIEFIRTEFRDMGLDVETQWIDVYLSTPVGAELEIVRARGVDVRETLPIKERPADDYSADPEISFGWNAYSASGEATGEIVYANYGTRADFDRLATLGVDGALEVGPGKVLCGLQRRIDRSIRCRSVAGTAGVRALSESEASG